ncbi:MAG: type 1 glutamine amidotransferase [Chitinispirillaceae bacterium]
MHIHVIRHVAFEGPGAIRSWAHVNAIPFTETHLYKGEPLPSHERYTLLVIMGGPMSVSDEKLFPWMKREKLHIEKAISSGKYVIGICLGAQMIASVMGAAVKRNRYREIGWFPIFSSPANAHSLISLPDNTPVLHWHGETFDIPSGCRQIARSAACENQCFIYDDRVVGMQFHLESTPEGINALVNACSYELTGGPYVQKAEDIISSVTYCKQTNKILGQILTKIKNGDV